MVEGQAYASLLADGRKLEMQTGDVVLFSHGSPHRVCDGSEVSAVPNRQLEAGSGAVPTVQHGGGGTRTRIICGSFSLDHAAGTDFFELLPPLLKVRPSSAKFIPWFGSTLDMLEEEVGLGGPGAEVSAARLADVLFVQILRAALTSLPSKNAGWIAALQDSQIGRALAAIHTEPAKSWTTEELAKTACLSRSTFFDRFQRAVGMSPAKYLTQWRVQTAADLVKKRPDLSNGELAGRVGYRSEDAFARAFKRHLGQTPQQLRES